MADESPVAQFVLEATDGGSIARLSQAIAAFANRPQKIKVGIDFNSPEWNVSGIDARSSLLIEKLTASVKKQMSASAKMNGLDFSKLISLDTGRMTKVGEQFFDKVSAAIPVMAADGLKQKVKAVFEKSFGEAILEAAVGAERKAQLAAEKVFRSAGKAEAREQRSLKSSATVRQRYSDSGVKQVEDARKRRQAVEDAEIAYENLQAKEARDKAISDKKAADAYLNRSRGQQSASIRKSSVAARIQSVFDSGAVGKEARTRLIEARENDIGVAERLHGVGSPELASAKGRIGRQYGKHLDTAFGRSDTVHQMAQDIISKHSGSPTGLGVRSNEIHQALDIAKKEFEDLGRAAEESMGKFAKGTSEWKKWNQESMAAKREAMKIAASKKELIALDKEEEALSSRKPGSGFLGMLGFGRITDMQAAGRAEAIQNRKKQISGGGNGSEKSSAHNAQFAMMNAAYGFQDFFQVLAQPGMGAGRAFLAMANNIGPAMGMIGAGTVGANVAIGGMLAGMTALNFVLGNQDEKLAKLARRLAEAADAYARTESARFSFETGSKPVGDKPGSSAWKKEFGDALSLPVGARAYAELARSGVQKRHSQEDRSWANDGMFGKFVGAGMENAGDKMQHYFTMDKEPEDAIRARIYAKPRVLSGFRNTGDKNPKNIPFPAVSGQLPSSRGNNSPGADKIDLYDSMYGLGKAAIAYEAFWQDGGTGQKIQKQIMESEEISKRMKLASDKSKGVVAQTVSGAGEAAKDESRFGHAGRGMLKRYINKSLDDVPGSAMEASEYSAVARNRQEEWNKKNGEMLKREKAELAKRSKLFRLASGAEVPSSDEDRAAVGSAPKFSNGQIAVRPIEQAMEEQRSIVAGLEAEKKAIDDTVVSLGIFSEQIKNLARDMIGQDGAGRIIAARMIPGFDSSGVAAAAENRKYIADGLEEFLKLAPEMSDSEKQFFSFRTEVTQFGDAAAKQKNRLSQIYSEMDSFVGTNLRKDEGANSNFAKSQIVEAGKNFGFDVSTPKQKAEEAARSFDYLMAAIARLSKQGKLSAKETEATEAMARVSAADKKAAVVAADPMERALNSFNRYREVLSTLDESLKAFTNRAKASDGAFTVAQARAAKFEEALKGLGFSLGETEQLRQFDDMVASILAKAVDGDVSPERLEQVKRQAAHQRDVMIRSTDDEVARRANLGGRSESVGFGRQGDSAVDNFKDKISAIVDEMDRTLVAAPNLGVQGEANVRDTFKKRVQSEVEAAAVSIFGYSMSLVDSLDRFDKMLVLVSDEMRKSGATQAEMNRLTIQAAHKKRLMIWDSAGEVAKRDNASGFDSRIGPGMNDAASRNFTARLEALRDKHVIDIKDPQLATPEDRRNKTEKYLKDIDKEIADFADSLGATKGLKDRLLAFDKDVESLLSALQDMGHSAEEIAERSADAARARRAILRDSQGEAARRANLGGRVDDAKYGKSSGRMLNFQDSIKSLQMELSKNLDQKDLNESEKGSYREAHAKAVQREIDSMVGGENGKSQLIDSGSLWGQIQDSLSGNDIDRQQLDVLKEINSSLRQGLTPSGRAGNLYQSMLGPAEGHDSGGYSGSNKKPSARDTINAKLRQGELVLTPEHQSRLASMFGLSASALFGSMGLSKGSLSSWAGSPVGFDSGGYAVSGAMLKDAKSSSAKYRTGFPGDPLQKTPEFSGWAGVSEQSDRRNDSQKKYEEWQKRQTKLRGMLDKRFKSYDDEEPFRDRYSKYSAQSKRMSMSSFYKNKGPVRKSSPQTTAPASRREVSAAEAWPGGMPVMSDRGSMYGMDMYLSEGGRSIPGRRMREHVDAGIGSERSRRSMQESAKQAESNDLVRTERAFGKERNSPAAENLARKMQLAEMKRRGMSQASQDSMSRTFEKSDAAAKKAATRASETDEEKAVRINNQRDELKAKASTRNAGPAFDKKQAYLDARQQGASKEEASKVAEQKERDAKYTGGPVSSTTRGTTRNNSWMQKADVSEREDNSGGLSKEKQDRLDELNKDKQKTRDVRGGDRGARWRAGVEEDRQMQRDGSKANVEAWKSHFEDLPGKLMQQNVPGNEQASRFGSGMPDTEKQTSLLEKIADVLQSSSKESLKVAEKMASSIKENGITVS